MYAWQRRNTDYIGCCATALTPCDLCLHSTTCCCRPGADERIRRVHAGLHRATSGGAALADVTVHNAPRAGAEAVHGHSAPAAASGPALSTAAAPRTVAEAVHSREVPAAVSPRDRDAAAAAVPRPLVLPDASSVTSPAASFLTADSSPGPAAALASPSQRLQYQGSPRRAASVGAAAAAAGGPTIQVTAPWPIASAAAEEPPGEAFGCAAACLQALHPLDQCDREAFLRMTGLDDEHLVFNAARNTPAESAPFFVAVDREQSTLVITIRGSLRCGFFAVSQLHTASRARSSSPSAAASGAVSVPRSPSLGLRTVAARRLS